MSDLSRLLDDVYGDTPAGTAPAAPAPAPAAPAGLPDWAMESVLDEAFADWVPGPPTVAADATDASTDDGHPATTDVPRSAFRAVAEEPAPAPEAWSRADDDILPGGRRRSARRSRSAASSMPSAAATAAELVERVDQVEPVEAKPSRFRRRKG